MTAPAATPAALDELSPQQRTAWGALEAGATRSLAAELAGVDRSTVHRWVSRWRSEQPGALPAARPPGPTPEAQSAGGRATAARHAAARLARANEFGDTVDDVSRLLRAVLIRWLDSPDVAARFDIQDTLDLCRVCEQLVATADRLAGVREQVDRPLTEAQQKRADDEAREADIRTMTAAAHIADAYQQMKGNE